MAKYEENIAIFPHLVSTHMVNQIKKTFSSSNDEKVRVLGLDQILHRTLLYLHTMNDCQLFLEELLQSLLDQDCIVDDLKAIYYHLFAISLAQNLVELTHFESSEFEENLSTYLETHDANAKVDQVWILNKTIYYMNSVRQLPEAGISALQGVERYKRTLNVDPKIKSRLFDSVKNQKGRWHHLYQDKLRRQA